MDPEFVQRFETIDQRFETMIQRFEQLNVRLDTRFEAIDRRFEAIDHRFVTIDGGFEVIDGRFQTIDGKFEELKERIEEVKRHSGVLVEGLRHEVHLLAEGLDTFINVRYAQDQATIQRQFRETQALIHLSYDQLRQRVENLERRDQN
jgi:predicted nuclease with TOPRIM domain